MIVESPPGRKARMILERERALFHSEFLPERMRLLPLVVSNGRGAIVEDVDGNRYLDFVGFDYNLGHCPRQVVEAATGQLQKLMLFVGVVGTWESYVRWAEKIRQIVPGKLKQGKVASCVSGSECVEYAMRVARYATGRSVVLAYQGGFHGMTPGTMQITTKSSFLRKRLVPVIGEAVHVPYPYCFRCPLGQAYPQCGLKCVDYVRWILDTVVNDADVAALVFEPIQGAGGVIVPPVEYWKEIKKLCSDHDILMIDDEIVTGFGRTGKWFAIEHWETEPDMICMAKSIAWGMPIAAYVGQRELMEKHPPGSPGGMLSSFGGSPAACEASLAGIALVEKENLLENADRLGRHLRTRLEELKDRHPVIGDIRGMGLMTGIELVQDGKKNIPAPELARSICEQAFLRGLIVAQWGVYSQVVRMFPPLNIKKEQIDTAVGILDDALSSCTRKS